jgi:hypothetical protein
MSEQLPSRSSVFLTPVSSDCRASNGAMANKAVSAFGYATTKPKQSQLYPVLPTAHVQGSLKLREPNILPSNIRFSYWSLSYQDLHATN